MKKIFLIMFAGLMLWTSKSQASSRVYSVVGTEQTIKPVPQGGPITPKMPARYPFVININEDTGNLYILFNRSIENVHISISGNGTIIDEDSESVMAGQTVIFNLGNYEEGQYLLTKVSHPLKGGFRM